MSLLIANDVRRNYGANEVLRGVNLRIEAGEKVGCVGRNGGGKSTLLRIITGSEQPDSGEIIIPRGVALGYVPQLPDFAAGRTAFEEVESGLEETRKVQAELQRLEPLLSETDGDELDRVVTRYGELSERMEFLGGWTAEQRVEQVMSGIGLRQELWQREARTLSGGEKSRVALARELVRRPDLLLLDEPTNHLDLDGIEWLEDYLKELQGAVYVVSHDRRLLENVVTTIVDLERGQLKRYPGNYSRYIAMRQERFDSELRAYEIQADKIRKEESFIKKHMGSQRTAEAKGRLKKLRHVERLERPYNDVRRPVLQLRNVPRSGEKVISAEDLSIGFGDQVLHSGLELRVARGDRIGLVGPNGAGKTTFMKTLAGKMQPLAGVIDVGHKAFCGFYDQETSHLDDEITPFITIRRAQPAFDDVEVRNHLALFLFRGNDVDLSVGSLSGGERARLALALLVLEEPSWLAMDEPTNHLDLAARTALEEMLSTYTGAMICISHDREFLDALCNKIIELGPNGLREFQGNYSEYRATITAERDAKMARKADAVRQQKNTAKRTEAQSAKKQSAQKKSSQKNQGTQHAGNQSAQKSSGAKPSGGGRVRNPQGLAKLEKQIMQLEARRDELLAEMATEEIYRDSNLLRERQLDLAEVERDLEQRNEEWANWG